MKYSQLIRLMRSSAQPDKERIRQKALKSDNSPVLRVFACISAAVILISLVGAGVYAGIMNIPFGQDVQIPDELAEISPIVSVIPSSADGNNIANDTYLNVTTSKNMSEEAFRRSFTVTPSTEYSVKKTAGNTFKVTFSSRLDNNTLYTIGSVLDRRTVYRWAFQTSDTFGITSRNPSDGYAPSNSSVSIDFTHSNVENFEESFSIYPSMSGTFEHYGRRWVFIPSSEFESNILYTVTISKSVCGGNNETLDKDYVFTFSTFQYDSYVYLEHSSNNIADCFLADEAPHAVLSYKSEDVTSADVNVYSISSTDEFIRLCRQYSGSMRISGAIESELVKLDKLYSFTTESQIISDDNGSKAYIKYPQSCVNGYYISQISLKNITLYQMFQVTDLAVYTITTGGDYTVWVNSVTNSAAASGAVVSIDGFEPQITSGDGTVTFECAQESDLQRYLTVKYGSSVAYVAQLEPTYTDDYAAHANNYYSYVYENSKVYRPGDTVNVWGFTLPRTTGTAPLTDLYLSCGWSREKISVKADANGCFTAEIKLSSSLAPNIYSLVLMSGDTVMQSREICIDSYVLPTYLLKVKADKNAYYSGDRIHYTIQASLYDGTPASGVSIFIPENEKRITTDENGIAYYECGADYTAPEDDNSLPSYYYNFFEVTEPDGQSVSYPVYVTVFDSDIVIESKSDTDDGSIKLSLNMLDISRYNENENNGFTGDAYIGKVTVELYEITYTRVENGSVYNPISMTTQFTYTYEENTNLISSNEYESVNANLILNAPPDTGKNASYYYKVSVESAEHKKVSAKYYLALQNSIANNYFRYSLNSHNDSYNVGDDVNVTLTDNQTGEAVIDGKLMLTYTNGRMLSKAISDTPYGTSIEFIDDFSPDIVINGALFDGRSVIPSSPLLLRKNETKLDIDISSDKQIYAPGDTVNLNVVSTGSDGKPVSAVVNVNVIDKALDDLIPDYSDMYYDIHFSRNLYNMIYCTTSSYFANTDISANGGGGGGGDYVRTDFEDTPFFDTIVTDSSGRANVSFVLPDGITEWTAYAHAYSENVEVGTDKTTFVATSDFYLSFNPPGRIKASDDAVFTFVSHGSELTDLCTYTATLLNNDNTVNSKASSSEIGNTESVNFGKLDAGTYALRIVAICGEYTDTVLRTFTVTQSETYVPLSLQSELSESTRIPADKFSADVTVSLYDSEYAFYYTVLDKLISSDGTRFEQKFGASLARNYQNGKGFDITDDNLLSEIRSYQGLYGISLFNDSSYITVDKAAKISAVAGKYFSYDSQLMYFRQVLEETPTVFRALCAYMGLASLGEPVLDDLNVFVNQISTMSDEEILYLGLAYAYAGDYLKATEIYNNYINPHIKNENGISSFICETPYETANLTALSAMLASRLSLKDAKDLVKSVLRDSNSAENYSLELSTFICDCVPMLDGFNTVTYYKADGTSEEMTFRRTDSISVYIPNADIGKIGFGSEKGSSSMTVSGYASSGTGADFETIEGASLTADIKTEMSSDDYSELTITATLPDDYADNASVSLVLPYSLKYVASECETGYISVSDANKSRINVYPQNNTLSVTITVYASQVGNFTFEPILLTDTKNNRCISTDAVSITVT